MKTFKGSKGWGIKAHKLPDQIDEEEIIKLIPLLKAGDVEAEKRLIEGLLKLSLYITSRYTKDDDSISEAFLAVVTSVKRAKNLLYDDNIKAFITSRVSGAIINYKCKEDLHKKRQQNTGKIENSVKDSVVDNLIIKEIVEKFYCEANELEKQVFDKLREGFYASEIARELNYTRANIHLVRKKIKTKIKRLLNERHRQKPKGSYNA